MMNNPSQEALAQYFAQFNPQQRINLYEQLNPGFTLTNAPSANMLGMYASRIIQSDPYLNQLQQQYLNTYWR